jgi:hypothetical protein
MAAVPGTARAVPTAATTSCAPTGADDEWRNLQDIVLDLADAGDVVVGVPRAAGGSGAIDVRLSSGARQHLDQAQLAGMPGPGSDDRFGASVAFVRADDDY